MTRIDTDREREVQIERHIMAMITCAPSAESCAIDLAVLTSACPPPLVRWFTEPLCQILAIAADAALSGKIPTTPDAIQDLAASMPHGHALDLRQAKPVRPWEPCGFEDSALANVGGWSALAELREQGLAYFGKRGVAANVQRLCHAGDRRRILQELRVIATKVANSDLETGPHEVVISSQDRLLGLLANPSERSLGDHLHAALCNGERLAALREQGRAPTATWGMAELDALVPLRPGGLYVLAAAPGAGKTSLALQAATACASAGGQGAVAIASLEMSGPELATIVAARQVGISPAAIRERAPSIPLEAWDQLNHLAATWRTSASVLVRDAAGVADHTTVDSLAAWLTQRRRASPGMALAVLDYLQLLDASNPRHNEYERITHATRQLKRTAVSLILPILCLSQMNRAGRTQVKDRTGRIIGDPEPTLANLRGSGSIEQDADAVVFLHQVGTPDPSAKAVLVRVTVAKNRAGAQGTVDMWFHRRHQLFQPARAAGQQVDELQKRAARTATAPHPAENVFDEAHDPIVITGLDEKESTPYPDRSRL